MRIFTRCILALVAIWTLATIGIVVIQTMQPTPEKFAAYVQERPLTGLSQSQRRRTIDRAARQLNGLTLEQRQALKKRGVIREFFVQLDHDERRRFMAMTLPEGFRQLIETLNRMDSVERKRLAQRTLHDIRAQAVQIGGTEGKDEVAEMISHGLTMFQEKADPQVQRDFSEVVEEITRRQEVLNAPASPP